jgi:signal transduction histidine kinase
MLQLSRGKAGERAATDMNALLDEAVHLTYHGMRAQDASFNITIEKDYDETIGTIEVVPQDMSRVFLNLIGNGCYAANKRKRLYRDGPPATLSVSTRRVADRVEIRVRDNGEGIPKEIRDKIFNPFFTTKPAGQGTGLGLSISYDIIVNEHGGEVRFESEEGEYTEFVVTLPRRA